MEGGVRVDVLVAYPRHGSLWLSRVEWSADSVQGETWDSSQVGSPYLPDDYSGERVWMNFPLSSVLKVRAVAAPPERGRR